MIEREVVGKGYQILFKIGNNLLLLSTPFAQIAALEISKLPQDLVIHRISALELCL